jgi:hypothetical protein
MRASTWNVPRFLHSFDGTIDGGLILPRGLIETVATLAEEAGSNLDVTDERSAGTEQKFTFTGTLTGLQREAVTDWPVMSKASWSRRRGRERQSSPAR